MQTSLTRHLNFNVSLPPMLGLSVGRIHASVLYTALYVTALTHCMKLFENLEPHYWRSGYDVC
jgi:hypothetical protein